MTWRRRRRKLEAVLTIDGIDCYIIPAQGLARIRIQSEFLLSHVNHASYVVLEVREVRY